MSRARLVGSMSAGKPTAVLFSRVRRAPAASPKPTMSTPTALPRSGGSTCGNPRPGTSDLMLIPTSLPGSNGFKERLATRSRLVFRMVRRRCYERQPSETRFYRCLYRNLPPGCTGDSQTDPDDDSRDGAGRAGNHQLWNADLHADWAVPDLRWRLQKAYRAVSRPNRRGGVSRGGGVVWRGQGYAEIPARQTHAFRPDP